MRTDYETQTWFTRREAAEYLRLSVSRLAHMASEQIGPRFFRNGKTVRYRKDDLDAWIMGEEVRPETEEEENNRIARQLKAETFSEFFES